MVNEPFVLVINPASVLNELPQLKKLICKVHHIPLHFTYIPSFEKRVVVGSTVQCTDQVIISKINYLVMSQQKLFS